MHGTNSSVVIDFLNKIVYFQSRNQIITPLKDNAGFAGYLSLIQEDFVNMIIKNLGINESDEIWADNLLIVYGEACGGSIQKGVALAQLEKMVVIFNAVIRTRKSDTESRNLNWLPIEEVKKIKLIDKKIYNIYDFKTWNIEIDFNKYFESTNSIIDMTIEVEDECPLAKAMGVSGIGEGIVFRCMTPGYENSDFWFKSKGEKHARSKVKTIRPVDEEKINRLIDIAEQVTPSWRLEQLFNETFDIVNGGFPDRSKIGNYIKVVNNDIVKEESLLLKESEVIFKDIVNYVSKIVRDYFFQMESDLLTNK